ncbi:MAG: YfhE family protein [Bacillus sp. (in: firmicutes)]
MDKKKKEKMKKRLNSTQEILYSREFMSADRAGGFEKKKY